MMSSIVERLKLIAKNIALFKQMAQIEKRHGDSSPPNVPAYKRLAMLYEKRGLFEESMTVCVDALQNDAWGDGMQARLARMIKKANRQPTEAELFLIEKDFSIKKSNLNFKN